MKTAVAAASALLIGALVAELRDVAGWLSPRLIRRAARRLPERMRTDREEEWLAELATMSGLKLTPFFWSVGVVIAAQRISMTCRKERSADDLARVSQASHEVFKLGRMYDRGLITRYELFEDLRKTHEERDVRLWRVRGELQRALTTSGSNGLGMRIWFIRWAHLHRAYLIWLDGRSWGFYRIHLARKYGVRAREVRDAADPWELSVIRCLEFLARPYRIIRWRVVSKWPAIRRPTRLWREI